MGKFIVAVAVLLVVIMSSAAAQSRLPLPSPPPESTPEPTPEPVPTARPTYHLLDEDYLLERAIVTAGGLGLEEITSYEYAWIARRTYLGNRDVSQMAEDMSLPLFVAAFRGSGTFSGPYFPEYPGQIILLHGITVALDGETAFMVANASGYTSLDIYREKHARRLCECR